jgi:hypothetical protein
VVGEKAESDSAWGVKGHRQTLHVGDRAESDFPWWVTGSESNSAC